MEQINHKKIAIKTVIYFLLVTLIIFLLNSFGNFRESFNGNIPPLSNWFNFKIRNILLILVLSAYYYYSIFSKQKKRLKLENKMQNQAKVY